MFAGSFGYNRGKKNFPRLNGTPELYQLYRQIHHSFNSLSFQLENSVRRYIHTVTFNNFLKYKQSHRKVFVSLTEQQQSKCFFKLFPFN